LVFLTFSLAFSFFGGCVFAFVVIFTFWYFLAFWGEGSGVEDMMGSWFFCFLFWLEEQFGLRKKGVYSDNVDQGIAGWTDSRCKERRKGKSFTSATKGV